MKRRILGISSLAMLFVVFFVSAQQPVRAITADQAFQGRQKAMQQLAVDGKQILDSLKALTGEQRNAVMSLITITKAVAAYESRLLKGDDPALRAIYGPLQEFSPAYKASGKFQGLLNMCFSQTVSCLSAQKKCQDGGKNPDKCDEEPRVLEACANEAICFTKEFQKLHQGIPSILGGRDPWPPQPFPF